MQPRAQFLVRECSGFRVGLKPGQRTVLLLPCPAGRICFAESAMPSRVVHALALPCQFGCRLQHLPCPGEKVGQRQLPGLGFFLHPGLHDAHAHHLDLVRLAEQLVGAEGVVHELRIALRADRHTLAVLEVDDVQQPAADHQAVAGAEALRHPPAHVHLLLDEHPGAAGEAHPQVVKEADVLIGSLNHLRGGACPFQKKVYGAALLPFGEVVPESGLAHFMRPGALCGILGLFVRQVCGGLSAGCAGDPPGGTGCPQQGVLNRRHRCPPRCSGLPAAPAQRCSSPAAAWRWRQRRCS